MCWQDVRIGRSQTLRSAVANPGAGVTPQVYPAWPNRVRLLISAQGSQVTVMAALAYEPMSIGVYAGPDNTYPPIYVGDVYGLLDLGFERFGSTLQGQISIYMDTESLGTMWCISEYELVDPIGLGDPRYVEV